MKKLLLISASLLLVIGLWACERPGSPDFELNHELEVPLSKEKTYPFLGGEEALLDTTSEDYEDFFSADADGMVSITNEEEFDFGDLEDAIPDVDADPTTVNAEVGEIELTNFSSGSGNVGEAGFQSITGIPSPSAGQTITGSSGTVNIPFSTDYFESAVIKNDGNLELVLTNNLGFDGDELEINLNSGSSFVGSGTIGTEGDPNDMFEHNTQETTLIDIPAETQLSDLNADVTVKWNTQSMQEEGDNLVVNDVDGKDLIAKQATAAVEPQSFTDSGTSMIDQSSFEFRDADDFVELSSGELTISIDNSINLGVESMTIDFPDIFDDSGNPVQVNATNIPASSDGGSYSQTVDLTGHQIKAQNGTIDYSIDATTENTQQGSGSDTRTISESDALDATVDLNNLELSRAEGYIVPDMVLLNTDLTVDGQENLDIFNDDEAETVEIDGINDISDRVSGLAFENPTLSTIYNTNLGVNTTIYAIIAGTDNNGNTEFLTGIDGTEYQVQDSEIPSELEVNGQPATADQVIKFSIDPVENPDPANGELGSNEFNASNTNSADFFNNLPNKIRFIGAAKVNNDEKDGTIVNPVIFDPTMGFDLPLNFSADNATFEDTLEADLGDLPGEGDDQSLKGATLTLNYTNALPLDLDLMIILLDENGEEVTHKSGIAINEAGVDENGYVNSPSENSTEISFAEDDLKQLNRTRDIKLEITLNTPDKEAVRIRKDDYVTLQMKIKADVTTTVN